MLRKLVLLLLIANLGWLAWSQGWLRVFGLGPKVQSEPERVAQQLQQQALTVRPLAVDGASPASAPDTGAAAPVPAASAPETARPAPSPPPAPAPLNTAKPSKPEEETTCLQAGVFDERQVGALRSAASARLPAGSWRIETVALPGRWMVYIGRLSDGIAVVTKRAELRAMGIDTDRPGAALEPGLSLGRFSTEEAANRALADLGRKGVRTARVVQERRDTPGYLLRLPAADTALRQRLRGLQPALAGKALRECD